MSPFGLLLIAAPSLAGAYYDAEMVKALEAGDLSGLIVAASPRSLRFTKKLVVLDQGQESQSQPWSLTEKDGEVLLRIGARKDGNDFAFRWLDDRTFETDVFGEPPSLFVRPKVPLEQLVQSIKKKEAVKQLVALIGVYKADASALEIKADGSAKLDGKSVETYAELCLESCETEKKAL